MKILQTIKNTKQKVEKIKPEEQQTSLLWPVFKVISIASLLLLSVMQVSAMFKDSTLEALEVSYKGSVIQYDKLVDQANQAMQNAIAQHDLRCSTYRALKAYKESKGYDIQDPTNNPCTEPLPFQQIELSQPKVQ